MVNIWLNFFISAYRDLIEWIFTFNIINAGTDSSPAYITLGSIIVYFGIVYVVISFLLHANIGLSREKIQNSRLQADVSRNLDRSKKAIYRQINN